MTCSRHRKQAARVQTRSVVDPSDLRELRTLGLATLHQGREVPTVGGLVLFGRDRHAFPDATVRCARFEGTDRARILDTFEAPESVTRFVPRTETINESDLRKPAVRRESVADFWNGFRPLSRAWTRSTTGTGVIAAG